MDPILLENQCYNSLPVEMREKPWKVTEHGRKVLQTEDEMNAYIAAYGEMHIIKCRAALQNFPFDELGLYPFEIFDWGCGQGLATLTLLDMLDERHVLSRLQKIYLIEPSTLALQRAQNWVQQSSLPHIEIVTVNKFIPNDVNALMPEVSCTSRISVNLFSNILDIRNLSLSWLANKVSSLAVVNYNICIGPKFIQNTNTRINDFCGYFSPQQYFSDINMYPYGYTTRTHHAFGCETKCFVHMREQRINSTYIECAGDEVYYDPYDYSTEALSGIVEDDVLSFYSQLRSECGDIYDIYLRPAINCDTIDFLLVSKSKGVVLLNICRNLDDIESYYNKAEAVKENLFNIHLRTIKIDSVLHRSVYNNVKTGLYFPTATFEEIQSKIAEINKEKNSNRKSDVEKDYFAYMIRLTQESNLKDCIGRLNSYGFKYEYYEELTNIISSIWHSYRMGDNDFRLTKTQAGVVRNPNPRVRVKGVAGCGKTQVVANRAVEKHLKTGDKVLILTFNISLIQYIRMRINQVPADFAPNMFEITNYHQFFKSKASLYAKSKINLEDFDNPDFFDTYRDKIKKYKTIIIDEVQDFKESWIQSICRNFLEDGGSVSVFGDGGQNIYDRSMDSDTKMPPLRRCGFPGGSWAQMSERFSMRILNPQISSLASAFSLAFIPETPEIIESQQTMNYNSDFNVKYWNINCDSSAETITSNIRWIMDKYHIHPEDVVVLGQSINLLRDIEHEYVRCTNKQTMINFETKSQYEDVKARESSSIYFRKDLEEIRRAAKTHFTTACPFLKLSTIHSFKGWEANTVVLILQPEMTSDETFDGYRVQERENTPALIYTAITRARRNLFILNLGNPTYHNFFSKNIQS